MSGSTADDYDPLDKAISLGSPAQRAAPSVSAAPTQPTPADYDPLSRAIGIGQSKGVLDTSFKNVQTRTPWESFTHGLGLGTRDVIAGTAGSIGGQLLDVATWPGRALIRAAGGTATAPSDIVGRDIPNAIGLATPETDAEKTKSEFIRGGTSLLTSALPGVAAPWLLAAPKVAPAGFLPKVANLARPLASTEVPASGRAALTQAVGGGTGAVLGEKLADSDYVPEAAKPTVRLIGNVLGNVGVNSLGSAAETLINAASGAKNEVAQALERLGITVRTPGAVSQSPLVQSSEAILSRTPTASSVLQPKQQETVRDFGDAVNNTARASETASGARANLPVYDTAAKTGTAVQDDIRYWRDNTKGRILDKAWEDVDNGMNAAGDVVSLDNLRAALQRRASNINLSRMPESQKGFANQQIQDFLARLDKDAPPGTKVDWKTARAYKTQVGDLLETPALVEGLGATAINDVYGGVAQDLGNAANSRGFGREFNNANTVTTKIKNFEDTTLSKAISGKNAVKETISPDNAATNLLDGTSNDLRDLRAFIPHAADKLAAFKLRDMAQAKPSQQGAAGDTSSTGTFLTEWNRLRQNNPEGADALFAHNPEVARGVKDLGTVAGQFRKVEKNMNTSGTAGSLALLEAIRQLGMGVMSGDWKQAGLAGAGLAAPYGVARAATSPLALWLAGAKPAAPPTVPGLLGGAITSQVPQQP